MGKLDISIGIISCLFVSVLGMASIDQKIRDDPDLSEFYALLLRSQLANVTLQFKQVTIFAPINAAFQKYGKSVDNPDNFVLYHITNVARKTDELGSSSTAINAELSGNPPLWITLVTGSYHDDIYVNNARILVSQSNIIGISPQQNDQILHKIDEVLIPTRSPNNSPMKLFNPNALEFLEGYESLIVDPYRVRSFRQKVQQNNKREIFSTEGGHTFFIPVDEGFRANRANAIDGKVIDGHVIPKQVLFTSPVKKDVSYQTLANGDNTVRVVIEFTQELRGKVVVNYVKSHTLLGDGSHTPGVVLAEIVKANIPVKNGVIHLIQKPLMVVDNTVKELLKEHMDYICNIGVDRTNNDLFDYPIYGYPEQENTGFLSKFYAAINDAGLIGQEFFNKIERSQGVTLFAPCNEAFSNDLALNRILQDQRRFIEILNMHVVMDERLYVDQIMRRMKEGNYQAPTLNRAKNLYFNVVNVGNNRTVTVEGGGVNATVIQADLAATNGVIHVINRVLGVPYSTILDKLRTDPMLNFTYHLGMQRGFNFQLNDTTKKFTFFAPSDRAWKEAFPRFPSEVKKLQMPQYAYQATNLLERHLVIADIPYTMERIKQLSNETHNSKYPVSSFAPRREVQLPTVRGGSLGIYVEERPGHSFNIFWRGERIPVFRPNVECTNGVIHVIDLPFLQEGDIRVNSASLLQAAPHLLTMIFIKLLLI